MTAWFFEAASYRGVVSEACCRGKNGGGLPDTPPRGRQDARLMKKESISI